MKPSITIVVPTTLAIRDGDEVASVHDALGYNRQNSKIDIDFIILSNPKLPEGRAASKLLVIENLRVYVAQSDIYLGSCEENLFRLRDFFSITNQYILILGDTDRVAFAKLADLLFHICAQQVDVAAINVEHSQETSSGGKSSAPLLPKEFCDISSITELGCSENELATCGGNAIKQFLKLVSAVGPLDWAAFIGSHVFSKPVLRRVLQETTYEPMYALTAMQIKAYSKQNFRYVSIGEPLVSRVANEFVQMRNGTFQWGWQVVHRLDRGLGAQCSISMVSHLLELENSNAFDAVITSRCYRHRFSEDNDSIEYFHKYFFQTIFNWCAGAVRSARHDKSHFFPSLTNMSNMHDIGLSVRLLIKIRDRGKECNAVYRHLIPENPICIEQIIVGLEAILDGQETPKLLDNIIFKLQDFSKSLTICELELARTAAIAALNDL